MPRQQELVRQRRQDKVIYLDNNIYDIYNIYNIYIAYIAYINYISTYLGKARGRGQEVAAGGGLCLHEGHHAEGDGAAGPESPGGG